MTTPTVTAVDHARVEALRARFERAELDVCFAIGGAVRTLMALHVNAAKDHVGPRKVVQAGDLAMADVLACAALILERERGMPAEHDPRVKQCSYCGMYHPFDDCPQRPHHYDRSEL